MEKVGQVGERSVANGPIIAENVVAGPGEVGSVLQDDDDQASLGDVVTGALR